jgi:O-succinylbenzoic acid--CoA ligase
VPSQVFCSIDHPLLPCIRNLIIGGGAISPDLEEKLHGLPNAVWSSYGMTETLSHIALRRVNGSEAQEWYTPLPGVSVSLNRDDCLCIDAPALSAQPLVTNDIAELSSSGSFRILGRRDNVIISGGLKLQTEVLETELRPLLAASDDNISFCVTSRPSAKFGEEAVLLVVPELLPLASEIHHSYIKAVILVA